MNGKLLLVLLLMVCLPLGLVGWVGVRLARDERQMVQQRFREVLTENLQEANDTVARCIGRFERELLGLTEQSSFSASELRQIVRNHPLVSQAFLIDADGQLLHPSPTGSLSEAEVAFLRRSQPFLADKDLVRRTPLQKGPAGSDGQPRPSSATDGPSPEAEGNSTEPSVPAQGWLAWYWGRGLNLVFWRRLATGHVVGIELDRSRWIAELIVELPDTSSSDQVPASHSRIRCSDSNDNVVYEWGSYEPPDEATPFVTIPVGEPLASWRLSYFVSDEHRAAISGRSVYFNLFAGLAVITLMLIGLAVYFYRESSREIREAETRVSFVNQVSHELRTPLTNIRLYAELMERDLDDLGSNQAGNLRERLDVIATESQRLSRLIGNVLAFARQQRGHLNLNHKMVEVDEVIRDMLGQFEPTMHEKRIEMSFQPDAAGPVRCDVDILEQILVNLLSNVEKYASDGGRAVISTSRRDSTTTILVADRGPGIPSHLQERVFHPFYRLSDRLEGAAGTGIGLAIVRSLARLHGGDATVVDSERGATFRVDLHTPRATDETKT